MKCKSSLFYNQFSSLRKVTCYIQVSIKRENRAIFNFPALLHEVLLRNSKHMTVTWLFKVGNSMCFIFNNCACVDVLVDRLCIHPHLDLKVYQLNELIFPPANKTVMNNGNWCQTLDQFTGVLFSDLKQNSRDITNIKFHSNVSTTLKLNANATLVKKRGIFSFLLKVSSCIF